MKRLLLISIISLLFVSGWSHVLAAALCPKTQAMAACPMQAGDKTTSSHETMGMAEMGDMQQMPATIAEGESNVVEQPMGSCPHCFKQPEQQNSPVVVSKGAEQSKRNLSVILQQAVQVITPQSTSFAPPISSRQHAPPQPTTARHVLISVFLI
jgi:hypothetical protein